MVLFDTGEEVWTFIVRTIEEFSLFPHNLKKFYKYHSFKQVWKYYDIANLTNCNLILP
jgi:hypothetical protein